MRDNKNKSKYYKVAIKTSIITIILNAMLAIIKFVIGLVGHSAALISDAVHSGSDVFSTLIVMLGVKVSSRAADKDHPYGHERLESIASLILAFILALTAIGIGYKGANALITGEYLSIAVPAISTIIVAAISIVVKEAMFWYTRRNAKLIVSDSLLADAWHHRSDALSSIGALVGIIMARMGYPAFDSIASILIAIFVFKVAVDIFRMSSKKLVDHSCCDEDIDKIKEIILSVDGVRSIDLLETRMFGNKIYVDVEIGCDGNAQLFDTHAIAEKVHDKVEGGFPDVKHCMVHVNPR